MTESGKSYFLLDSKDYWYDVIQQKYPAKLMCKCKSDLFRGKCVYYQRDNSPDYFKIDFITTCNSCGAKKNQFEVPIDYSPTDNLFETPLVFCPNPKIKYKLFQINSFWTSADAISLAKFLSDNGLRIFVLYLSERERVLKEVSLAEVSSFIEAKRYLKFFFSKNDLDVKSLNNKSHCELWRRNEVIELRFPITMQYDSNRQGSLYYINYCSEYINEGKIVSKTNEFKIITEKLTKWFSKTYYTGRGKQCADNEKEYSRLFGEN